MYRTLFVIAAFHFIYYDYRNHNLMMKCVHTSEDKETSCRVRSVDRIVIPSRHEAVIKSKVIPSTNRRRLY